MTNYPLVERVVRWVARRHRLKPDAAEELESIVHLKLVEDDYAVLRKFEGRSSLATSLTTVVNRVYLDWRTAEWGRWRSSTEAMRLGATAVRLEMLIARDDLTFEEAAQSLRTNFLVTETDAELETIYARMPRRMRRRNVGEEALATVAAPEPVSTTEDEALLESLARSMASLDPDDRRLLHLRFVSGWTVVRIAGELRVTAKLLYRRLERLRRQLKVSMTIDQAMTTSRNAAPNRAISSAVL